MSQEFIKVVGLGEFRANLRRMDRDKAKAVRVALNDAAEILVTAVRPQVPALTGAARASVKAQSTQTTARVAVGGPKAPYYPWLDFGGRVGRKKATVRTFYKSGRYVYPTLAKKREEIQAAMLKSIVQLAESSGIEVS